MNRLTITLRMPQTVVLAAISLLFFGIIVSLTMKNVHAGTDRLVITDERIITVYEDGTEKGFYTKAITLRAALKEAAIRIDPNDRTEPGLDEKLVAHSYEVNIYRARPVMIRDGASETKIVTAFRTGKQIAEQAKITLHEEDTIKLKPTDDIVGDGAAEIMTITRAIPFTFVFYGKTITSYTQEKTVGAMLKSKGITLAAVDTITPAVQTALSPNMTIKLWRNGKQTITQEEVIAKPIERVKDADREVGFKEVRTVGVDGKKIVTYEIEMRDGKEVSRQVITSVTTLEPVKEVVIEGAKFSNTFSGSFAEALARLRSCEGSYTSSTGNGYYGAYQYDIQTWGGYMGYANASLAPPEVQDQKVWETYQRRSWQPWPSCSIKMGLQDIYR